MKAILATICFSDLPHFEKIYLFFRLNTYYFLLILCATKDCKNNACEQLKIDSIFSLARDWLKINEPGNNILQAKKIEQERVHQFGRRAPVSSFLKSSEKFKYKASKKFNENMGM
jgi:hypothetical protein